MLGSKVSLIPDRHHRSPHCARVESDPCLLTVAAPGLLAQEGTRLSIGNNELGAAAHGITA